MKNLRIWNGRCYGRKYPRHHAFVAAYSLKQATELLTKALFEDGWGKISPYEIKTYYSADCWGNTMDGIEPTEPCVYLCDKGDSNNKPFKVP